MKNICSCDCDCLASESNPNYPYPSPSDLDESAIYYETVKLKLPEPRDGFSKRKIILEILKNFNPKTFFRISIPIVFISPLSLLEYITKFFTPPESTLSLSETKSAEERFIEILKGVFLNLQRCVSKEGICHTKPYNPIIGEIFYCKWRNDDSVTYCLAEQVSHHPPITSIYISNRKKNFCHRVTLYPNSKLYPNSLGFLMNGEFNLSINNLEEEYVFSFPTILSVGILLGKQRIEYYDTYSIKCDKTGYSASFKFKSKDDGKLSGSILKDNKEIYKIKGFVGKEKISIINVKEKSDVKEVTNEQSLKFINETKQWCRELKDQKENESRRNWHCVTKELIEGNDKDAAEYKNAIENMQRIKRKKRKKEKKVFVPKYFKKSKIVKDKQMYECIYENRTAYVEGEVDQFENLDIFKY